MSTQIERVYSDIRSEERRALAERTAEAYARAPELAALPGLRQAVLRDAAARRIDAAESAKRLQALDAREQALLLAAGLPADTLTLRSRCPQCRDTGWLGGTSRRPCACRLKYMAQRDPAIGINERETFETFSLDVFPDEGQKKRTVNAKNFCMAYADTLPNPEKPNLLLMGMPGLGKSFLCNAIAYRALCRGLAARRVTAYAFVEDALAAIRNQSGRSALYVNLPLLVIDDLGSEPVVPNVSEEALFSLLNERLNARRATVVATNLSVSALQDRYGERVMSRLTDRSAAQPILLTGENLRWSDSLC